MNRQSNYFVGQDHFGEKFDMYPPEDYTEVEKMNNEDDHASLDSDGKKKSFTRLCVRFAEKTSMQGLPYINAAKLWYAKVLWVLLLLGGIVGMTLHLYFLIDQYLMFDVQVTVKLGFNNLHFPAVTICNLNAVKKNRYDTLSQPLQSFIETTDPGKIKPAPPPGSPPGKRRKRAIEEYGNIDYDNYSKEFDFRPNLGTRDSNHRLLDTFETMYMEESRIKRRNAGHQMKDMLLQCSLGGYECYPSNFTLVQTQKYGNCYTIQSDEYVVTSPGPKYGLSLVLYLETEEYLSAFSQGYGARVQIHDRNTYPFPADEGLYVPSSFETHIGLKQIEIVRLDGLYGDCTNTSSYYDTYGARYTRTLCQIFCEQTLIVERCDCFDLSKTDIFKSLNTSFPDKPCRTDIERKCLAEYAAERVRTTPDCPQCTNPCNEEQYVKSFSSRNWPTDEYANVLMQSVCERFGHDRCTNILNISKDQFSLGKKFMKIVVYFEDLNYERVEETPEIEVQQFASDVGGAIGLWIGLSIISVFELVQLLLECCAFGVHKCRKDSRPPPSKRARKNKKSVTGVPKEHKENEDNSRNKSLTNNGFYGQQYDNWRNRF